MSEPIVKALDFIGENIDLASKARTKNDALHELCHMLKKHGVVSDEELFYQDVLKREKVGATGMENGIAIPHGESPAANMVAIAVLKTEQPLAWESLDNQPIHLVFLLVVPTIGRDAIHLKLLSHLSAALTHKEIQDRLLQENDVNRFKQILRNSGGL